MSKNEYIENLIQNCEKAKLANPTHTFVYENIEQLKDIKQGIYIIEEIDGDNEQTFNDLAQYKQYKGPGKRACPKLNSPSPVMYVGSSRTGIKKRISEHLGDGSKKTYALHLDCWFKGKVKITIYVYQEAPEVLQIIEDALSHQLSPAFGKRGGNNK
ncbi:MAG: hypothetical protein RJB18_421 [Pseudomonadota bacterium]|jgi:hypothetical protein